MIPSQPWREHNSRPGLKAGKLIQVLPTREGNQHPILPLREGISAANAGLISIAL